MAKVLVYLNRFVWGIPALVLILGVGIYLTACTGFVQFRMLPKALKLFCKRFSKSDENIAGVSGHQALCTALAATVGTGNIAGVAGAITLGGPGAIFWMWICAFIGMATKYAEAVLSVLFHVKLENGERIAGPMYTICYGMGNKWKWLASLYCFLGLVASFGVGNAAQINAVISGINSIFDTFGLEETTFRNLLFGCVLALLIGAILLGGAKRIGKAAEQLIPFASLSYLLLCVFVLAIRFSHIPVAFRMIIEGAFSPRAVTGGALGSAFAALRIGVARGVFTNEAGLGTAGVAHGSADVVHPVEQGLMGIVEVFLDTVVICTMTALVILCSGISVPFGRDTGAELTIRAFSAVLGPWVKIAITVCLCLFAVATVLAWGLYGARFAQFLFGTDVWRMFAILQCAMVIPGAILDTGTLWLMTETLNGLMAIPNLIALFFLAAHLINATNEYRKKYGRASAGGGTYENFDQRQPLRTFSHEKVPPFSSKGEKKRKEDLSSEYWSA